LVDCVDSSDNAGQLIVVDAGELGDFFSNFDIDSVNFSITRCLLAKNVVGGACGLSSV